MCARGGGVSSVLLEVVTLCGSKTVARVHSFSCSPPHPACLSPLSLPAPRIVFSIKKYHRPAPARPADRQLDESFSPAHEQNVRFVHRGEAGSLILIRKPPISSRASPLQLLLH